MIPGAVELNPTDACRSNPYGIYGNDPYVFNCWEVFSPDEPWCYAANKAPSCEELGTTITCDAASGANLNEPPVCSRILGANPAASNTTDSPGLCSTTGTLQPCTILT